VIDAGHQLQVRFEFTAPGLRAAVDLAAALREHRAAVQVRPDARHLLTTRRWRVTATTPPGPVMPAAMRLWEEQMKDVAQCHAGCSIAASQPIVTDVLTG